MAAAEKASSVAETRANASETSASEIVAVARARVQNAEKEAFETEAAAQKAVEAAKRAVDASGARAARAEAETKRALAAMRASVPDAAVSRALAARWRCAAAVSNARRVAGHCYPRASKGLNLRPGWLGDAYQTAVLIGVKFPISEAASGKSADSGTFAQSTAYI